MTTKKATSKTKTKTKKDNVQTKQRINLVIDKDKYALMQEQMQINGYKTLTDLVITRCTNPEQTQSTANEMLELELRHARELLNNALNELDHARMDLDKLQARNDLLQNTVIWHSLPFWKKIGKNAQLPNKQ